MLEKPQPLSQDLCTEGPGISVFQSCSEHCSVQPALESLTASVCIRTSPVLASPKLRQTYEISVGLSRQGSGHLQFSEDPRVIPMDILR